MSAASRADGEGVYAEVYARALADPEGFWGEQAGRIEWTRTPQRVLDTSRPSFPRWFSDGVLNTCHNALDRHVEAGAGERLALIYDSPVTGAVERITYAELRRRVAHAAGGLKRLGVRRDDRVVIFMPMVPEAVVAMLACARLGAVHVVVFGGFAANELAVRIDHVRPKVVLSATCGLEAERVVPYLSLLEDALSACSHQPGACVILERPQAPSRLRAGRDHDWHEALAGAEPVDCVPVGATDPLYVLHTSGTTGRPKGVVRDNGGHAVALELSMDLVYDMQPGDVFWAASDIGWVVGHSYTVYGPLLRGCTSVLYEGKPVGTPDAGAFWRVLEEHGVNALFAAPTALRAIKQADPDGKLLSGRALDRFRTLFVAGERCDTDTLHWARKLLGVPVIDHWWQTETGWAICANPMGLGALPVKPGSPTKAMPGYDVHAVDEQGADLPAGEVGAIVIREPLPPAGLLTLWEDDDAYLSAYMTEHPGFYTTGDAGAVDEDGYVWIFGRTDDVINVAGHRLSTGAIEEALSSHPDVAESAVVGVPDALKGEQPLAFAVLKAGVQRDARQLEDELRARVREQVGPVASLRTVRVVERLPKTRSGKILRGTIRRLAAGQAGPVPATIEDPAVLSEIATVLAELELPS